MTGFTLLIDSLLALLAAAIYLTIGRRLKERTISDGDTRMAWRLFSTFWTALAITSIISALMSYMGFIGFINLPLFETFTQTSLLFISYAVFALLYYLLFLFTGNSKFLTYIALLYGAFYLFTVYLISYSNPIGVEIGHWTTSLIYENTIEGSLSLVVLAFLIAPTLLGSAAYFSLFFRVQEPTQKYRILLVSSSIVIWFGSSLALSAIGAPENDIWSAVTRLIGIAAAATIYLAYFPPAWVTAQWKIKAVIEAVGK